MRITNDRLQQLARIPSQQLEHDPRDSIITFPPVVTGVMDLSDPIRRFLNTSAAAAGSSADPVQESVMLFDAVDLSGVQGLDTRNIAFFTAGLWHLQIAKRFSFTGTTNLAKTQLLQLTTTADLGVVVATVPIDKQLFITGAGFSFVRDMWLPMLSAWTLVTVTTNTVAGDELHSMTSIVARRFI